MNSWGRGLCQAWSPRCPSPEVAQVWLRRIRAALQCRLFRAALMDEALWVPANSRAVALGKETGEPGVAFPIAQCSLLLSHDGIWLPQPRSRDLPCPSLPDPVCSSTGALEHCRSSVLSALEPQNPGVGWVGLAGLELISLQPPAPPQIPSDPVALWDPGCLCLIPKCRR